MRFWAKALGAGLVSVGIGAGPAPVRGQNAPAPQAPAPQNSVPDAPKPQTLPQINSITPVAPATPDAAPNAPTPQPDAGAANNGGVTPGSSLTSAAPASAPADGGTSADQQTTTPGGTPATHASDIRVSVNFVQIPFTVKDSKGSLVPGLTWRDVRVFENGAQQQIRLFTVDPIPLSVAIVIDQSVTFDTMQEINASLDALQSSFTPYDEVAVYTYNNGVREQTAFSGAQSARVTFALQRSRAEGREPLMPLGGPLSQTTVKNNQAVDPNTNGNNNTTLTQANNAPREYHTLNDAILTAAQAVAKAGRGRRRVIYVISDGKEYGSQAKEKEVIRFLQTNQIAVSATLVGDSSIPGVDRLDKYHLPFTMRDNALPRYVTATGGDYEAAFRPRSIENSFAKLTEEVRTQYVAGYYSHEPFIDGKYRPVEVRVLRPNLDVIAKKGYYPTASDARPNQPARTSAAPGSASTGSPDQPATPAATPVAGGTPPTP